MMNVSYKLGKVEAIVYQTSVVVSNAINRHLDDAVVNPRVLNDM